MDYLIVGPQLKHYIAPHASGCDIDFQEAITEIAEEKIKELKIRLEEITEQHNLWVRIYKTLKVSSNDISQQIDEFCFQEEKYYIQLWLKYWKSFINKPKVPHAAHLTADNIQEAKQFPIEQLYIGTLRQFAGRLKGICPFHKEKTPSFIIFPENIYHCFGCNAHGDSITFLMETKQLNFPQAVKELI